MEQPAKKLSLSLPPAMAQFIFGPPVRWSTISAYDEMREEKPPPETRKRAAGGGHGSQVSQPTEAAGIIAGPSKNETLFPSSGLYLPLFALSCFSLFTATTILFIYIRFLALPVLALLLPHSFHTQFQGFFQQPIPLPPDTASLQAKGGSLRPSHSREIPLADIGASPIPCCCCQSAGPPLLLLLPPPQSCAPPVLPPPSILPAPSAVCSTAMAAAVGRTSTANEKCGQPNNASFPFSPPQRTIKEESDFAPAFEEWTTKRIGKTKQKLFSTEFITESFDFRLLLRWSAEILLTINKKACQEKATSLLII
jgi:hypothetical protein